MRTDQASGAKPRIAFVINSLSGGGAERVFCQLVEGLRNRLQQCEAEIVLLDDEPAAYATPEFLPVSTLDARRGFGASVRKLIKELARLRPHVAVSFLSRANCANVIASRFCGHRTVISERVATAEHFGPGLAGELKRTITCELYRRADAIVAVSQGVREGLMQACRMSASRIEVIANPVDAARVRAMASFTPDRPLPERFIVSVNRLAANKNVALQVDALHRSGLPHHLVVLGEGPEDVAIEARADTLGLRERVHLLRFIANPFAVVARAEMFVSTSNAEGFPNALVEAMALGVPCMSTNCRSGPAEILADNPELQISGMHAAPFGVLTPVNDVGACAEAMRFLAQPKQRARYSAAGPKRVTVYAPQIAIERYWQVIERVGRFAAFREMVHSGAADSARSAQPS